MSCLRATIAALLIAVGAPSASSAELPRAEVVVTYTGVVLSGADSTGVFGPTSDLAGRPFRLSFRFDSDAASLDETSHDRSTRYGGRLYGASVASPCLGATLSVGAGSIDIDGRTLGRMHASRRDGLRYHEHEAQQYSEDAARAIHLSAKVGLASADLGDGPLWLPEPFHLELDPDDEAYGYFYVYTYRFDLGVFIRHATGQLRPQTVTVAAGTPFAER